MKRSSSCCSCLVVGFLFLELLASFFEVLLSLLGLLLRLLGVALAAFLIAVHALARLLHAASGLLHGLRGLRVRFLDALGELLGPALVLALSRREILHALLAILTAALFFFDGISHRLGGLLHRLGRRLLLLTRALRASLLQALFGLLALRAGLLHRLGSLGQRLVLRRCTGVALEFLLQFVELARKVLLAFRGRVQRFLVGLATEVLLRVVDLLLSLRESVFCGLGLLGALARVALGVSLGGFACGLGGVASGLGSGLQGLGGGVVALVCLSLRGLLGLVRNLTGSACGLVLLPSQVVVCASSGTLVASSGFE